MKYGVFKGGYNIKHELPEWFIANHPHIQDAFEFATRAHHPQIRKFGNKDHYITHPARVAEKVFNTYVNDESISKDVLADMVAAAFCHDVVEDTKYTTEDVLKITNYRTQTIVHGLTDLVLSTDDVIKAFPGIGTTIARKVKNTINKDHNEHAVLEARLVKHCDIYDNVNCMNRHIPKTFAHRFLNEKLEFVESQLESDYNENTLKFLCELKTLIEQKFDIKYKA